MKLTQKQIYALMRAATLESSPFRIVTDREDEGDRIDIACKVDSLEFWLFQEATSLDEFKLTDYTTCNQVLAISAAWIKLHSAIADTLAEQARRDAYDSQQLALRLVGESWSAFGTKSCDYDTQAEKKAILGIGGSKD